uniref:PtmR3 n=1 Tax=Streptomyces platensis TaxID=58346 RepID=D8L2V1_STRPT|nr:PtmR3 [Streptomyces platensis]
MTAAEVPRVRADLDAGWLEAALRGAGHRVRVTGLRVAPTDQGTSTRIPLAARFSGPDAAALPDRLFVKTSLSHPLHEVMAAAGIYVTEVRMYQEVLPAAPVAVPAVYASGYSPDDGRFFLLMEDLTARGCDWGAAGQLLTPDAVAGVLSELAALHARFRDPVRRGGLSWVRRCAAPAGSTTYAYARRGAEAVCAAADRAGPAGEEAGPESWMAAFARLTAFDDAVRPTLLHGDPHPGNLAFVPGGRPVLADWQAARRGHWAHDVAYLLASALSPGDRAAHERDLLAGYLDEVAARGAAVPSFAGAWDAYRAQMVYGLLMWAATPEGSHPAKVLAAVTQRFRTACTELESLTALGR